MFGKDMNSHMNKGNREATAVKCRKATKDHQNKGALWRVREWKQRWQHRTRQVQYSDTRAVGWECHRHQGTQGHNEPTTPGWSLSNGAALPPQPTPDTSMQSQRAPGLETALMAWMDQNSCWDTLGPSWPGEMLHQPPLKPGSCCRSCRGRRSPGKGWFQLTPPQ